ncbi:MAG: helix-turn-helix transcriptional regulator [Desulfobacteraceae bacterium]|jgi:ribosome-binding protein aMBF1 (putative translation factor)
MILNQRQYSVTKAQKLRLQKALEFSKGQKGELDKKIYESMIAGLKSQIGELKDQLKEYEKIQNAKSLDYSLENLPSVLIKARVALGWTQGKLAKKLNVDPRQIQRYEKTNYSSVSLERAIEILQVMGIDLKGRIDLHSKKVA